jgi:hypothetical protein
MRRRHAVGYARNIVEALAQIALKLNRQIDCTVMERRNKKYEMVKIALAILGYDIRQ